jgi:hypothetical protein
MNETQIKNSLTDLNSLVMGGQLMEAFEKYYHDDVVMQENSTRVVKGKIANRKREIEFLNNILEFRSASVKGLAVGNDVSFVIWSYDYTHKEWGVRNYTQVSVQHWQDGLIVKEQFFYGN